MFPTLGLFQSLPCPEKSYCQRSNCVFSHRPDITHIPVTAVPVDAPKPAPAPAPASASKASVSQPTPGYSTSIPTKRSVSSPLRVAGPSNGTPSNEPPKKLLRTGPPQRPIAVPSGTQTTSVSAMSHRTSLTCVVDFWQSGVPLLRVSPAQSAVAVPVRQVRLFRVLCNPHTDSSDRRC